MREAILHLAFDGLGAREAVSDAFVDNRGSNAISGSLGYEANGLDWATRQGEPAVLNRWRLTHETWLSARPLADEVRVWRRDGQILAAGMVDSDSGLIRMAIAPTVNEDEAFATQLLADMSDPGRGVLPADRGLVEARFGAAFRDLLNRSGWVDDEPWTPLYRDLAEPVEDCGLRIEPTDTHHVRDKIVQDRVAVQRAAFSNSTFSLERWQAMAASPAYSRARCLVAYDHDDHAVAAATVWSAGHGRPGLIEPLGGHPDHRGHGYGRAITVAAAAALRDMGASSVTVCTPSSSVGGVAAYVSAGFDKLPDVPDYRRPS